MNDRDLMILGGLVGAVVGVGVGFTVFTERGRRLRAELQPEIESVLREAVRLSQVVEDFTGGKMPQASALGGASTWPRRTV